MFTPFKHTFFSSVDIESGICFSVHLFISHLDQSSMSVRTDDQNIIIIIRTSSFLYFVSMWNWKRTFKSRRGVALLQTLFLNQYVCVLWRSTDRFDRFVVLQRLIVCLVDSYHIHNIRDMKVMHTLEETPENPSGLCALSTTNDTGFIAYPSSTTDGSLEIFDSMAMVRRLR